LVSSAEKYGIYPTLAYGVGDPGTDTPNYYDSPGGQPPMANSDHTPAFWQSVANAFKGDPNVIFRLEEEPRPLGDSNTSLAAWQCWSQGDVQYLPSGDSTTPPTPASSSTHCPGITDDRGHAFKAVGMQSMLNIIRGAGATNVIQVPGVAYADALSCGETVSPVTCGFLDSADGVKVNDTLTPAQLGADTDNYPDVGQICGTQNNVPRSVACFNTMYGPVAAVMPYDSGETGVFGSQISGGFPVEQAYINWMDSHAGNYYFAAWTVAGAYNMISSYNGTPINPWGTWVFTHMTG
jgi:endoglucanase